MICLLTYRRTWQPGELSGLRHFELSSWSFSNGALTAHSRQKGRKMAWLCLGQANMYRSDIARWVRARIVEALKTRKRKRV